MASSEGSLLFSIAGIKAFHIQDGVEHDLNPSGPQTLSLMMVPTETHGYNTGPGDSKKAAPEIDFFLHLNLPPELDLPLPATTQIYHQPPRSYLIPRWDVTPDGGCFTRIEFPPLGRGVRQEDVDTFETILAQCTAFLEREPAPQQGSQKYNPGDYKPGEAYAVGTARPNHGQIVLIDEENGSVVGELADGSGTVVHDEDIKAGQKGNFLTSMLLYIYRILTSPSDPVEITISADGKRIDVKPLSEDYLALSRLPHYQNSSLVQNAAAASRLIVTTSSYIANMMTSGAETFQQKTKPVKPVTFSPTTHNHVRKINSVTASAADISSKTVGQAQKIAQNIGAKLAHRGERKAKGEEYKPGLLNKSMIAFSTVADGVATSGKHLLGAGATSTTAIVGHRYGDDARKVASELTTGVTNVGLVYIDVTGVSRRAVIKSVAKGMVVGRVRDGGMVVVGGGDGGEIPVVDPHAGPSAISGAPPPGYSKGDYKGPGGSGSEKWQ
jgi:spartin